MKKIIIGVLLVFCFQNCSVRYSFTGANTLAKTIFVSNFQNRSTGGPPSLNIDFTEKLKEYYQRNSALRIVDKKNEGELSVTGSISGYTMSPIAATADQAAQNRLTITVEVDFVNTLEQKKNFKQNFSFYSDFPPNQSLSQVEGGKINEILEQIILDIFNKTVADW
ncbi:MAG: hypothetical protein EAZ85_13505 [Bacteroidetes bacterium]|nr:MAG: hypothetical protein EAZ85_13505 [Bacteroidota bacterium]